MLRHIMLWLTRDSQVLTEGEELALLHMPTLPLVDFGMYRSSRVGKIHQVSAMDSDFAMVDTKSINVSH